MSDNVARLTVHQRNTASWLPPEVKPTDSQVAKKNQEQQQCKDMRGKHACFALELRKTSLNSIIRGQEQIPNLSDVILKLFVISQSISHTTFQE